MTKMSAEVKLSNLTFDFNPYLLFFSKGFQGKNGPPGPPGVVGPQVG